MVLKRNISGEENGDPQFQATQQRNQRFKFTKCICNDKLWLQAYSAQLENLIRKVVREEVEQAIQHSYQSSRSLSQAKHSESRKFKLQFEGKLPNKLFSGNKVEAEGPLPIQLFLVDATTGHRVTDGPLSSTRVKIVVLHGHFKAEELESWTKDEFDNNIVSERDGRRPLLVGQHVVLALQNGVGSIVDVCFTDNSSWERSKMFRLGAKAEAKEDQVMEAVSTSFEVKDRRGENYQKHSIPSPEDEVWRLYWIAKDGKICKRLAEHQIYTVKDFVTQYYIDESLLRQILNVSPKKWQTVIKQATSCFPDNITRNLSDLDIPGLNLCMPPDGMINDQQEVLMSHCHTEEHNDMLNESMALNNPFLMNLLSASCSDGNSFTLNDSMLPSFPNMFNVETTSWLPVAQPIGEEDHNFLMGSSYNSDIGMPSFIPNVNVNASEITTPKKNWGKVRAILRILVKQGEAAIRKGKFPHYSNP